MHHRLTMAIYNIPIVIHVLHQTHRQQCLLEHLWEEITARQDNCLGVRYCIATRYCIRHIWLLSLGRYCLIFKSKAQQTMWSRFLKQLENLTHRRVSHRAGLIQQALKKLKCSTTQGFCHDWLKHVNWLILRG